MIAWCQMRVLLFIIVSLYPVFLSADKVNVSGSDNVGIRTMNGGTVNVGLTPQEVDALASASGDRVFEQLVPILKRINDQLPASDQQDKIVIEAAETIVAVIQGKQVPLEEWPVEFGRLIHELQKLGRQIRNMSVTGDVTQAYVEQAYEFLQKGDFDETDRLLISASDLVAQEIGQRNNKALESTRLLASLTVSRAILAMMQLDRTQSAILYQEAAELRRDDESSEVVWWLIEAGDVWQTQQQGDQALLNYRLANAAALSVTAVTSSNTQAQHDLSVSYERLGDIERRLSNSESELDNYNKALGVRLKLVESEPANTQFLHDVHGSYMKLGDTEFRLGNIDAAFANYQKALEIRLELVELVPGNTQFLHDVSFSYSLLGYHEYRLRNTDAAMSYYSQALEVRLTLVKIDPDNTRFLHDATVSYETLGDIQRHLSEFHGQMGNIDHQQRHINAALNNYHKAHELRVKLVELEPGNIKFQRNVFVSNGLLGVAYKARGDLATALSYFQVAQAQVREMIETGKLLPEDSRIVEDYDERMEGLQEE